MEQRNTFFVFHKINNRLGLKSAVNHRGSARACGSLLGLKDLAFNPSVRRPLLHANNAAHEAGQVPSQKAYNSRLVHGGRDGEAQFLQADPDEDENVRVAGNEQSNALRITSYNKPYMNAQA